MADLTIRSGCPSKIVLDCRLALEYRMDAALHRTSLSKKGRIDDGYSVVDRVRSRNRVYCQAADAREGSWRLYRHDTAGDRRCARGRFHRPCDGILRVESDRWMAD